MPELTPEQRAQLDKNIRMMLNNGASEGDVMTYSSDFRKKYDLPVEKKSKVGGVSPIVSNSDVLVPLNVSPEQPTNEFASIENALVENKTAGDRLRKAKTYNLTPTMAPGYVPVDTEFQNQYLAEETIYKKQTDDVKNAVLKANKEKIVKPVNDLVESGGYKQFITDTGVFDYSKAISYFDDYVKKRGGGNYSRDMMVATMKQAAESEHDKPRLKIFLDEEYKKKGINAPF